MAISFSLRRIKSFTLRQGRLTDRQQEALDTQWSHYVLPLNSQQDFSAAFDGYPSLILEIGFGMGHSFFEDAVTHPEHHFIGIEVYKPGIGSVLSMLKQHPLSNVNVVYTDAVDFLNACIPDGVLNEVHIFFPDPWPKRRHHKRRLIQAPFVKLLAQKLKSNGRLHLATDWEDYAKQMHSVLTADHGFYQEYSMMCPTYLSDQQHRQNIESDADTGAYSAIHEENYEGYAKPVSSKAMRLRSLTKYEQRGQKAGHGIWDLIFRKAN